MKYSIEGCPGAYEPKSIVHTVRFRGQTIVIDKVPAEVCSVCGDVLLSPDTVRQIEALLRLQCAWFRSMNTHEQRVIGILAVGGQLHVVETSLPASIWIPGSSGVLPNPQRRRSVQGYGSTPH